MIMDPPTNHRTDDFVGGFGDSDIIQEGAIRSPNSAFLVGTIGKLGGDWNHELSPIAPNRDSLNGNKQVKVSAISLGSKNPECGEQKPNTSVDENNDTNAADTDSLDVKSSALSPKHPAYTFSEANIGEKQCHWNGSGTINIRDSENAGQVGTAWFLAADRTTPLSTSSEFSLESLSPPTDKSASGGTPPSFPKEQYFASNSVKSEEVSEKCPCKGEGCKHLEDVLDIEGNNAVATMPSEKAEISGVLENVAVEQVHVGGSDRGKNNSPNTSRRQYSEQAPRLSTLSSDDALVQDATEKVKKFIYELSLSSSRLSIDEQPQQQGEDPRQEENHYSGEKEERSGEVSTTLDVVRRRPIEVMENVVNMPSEVIKKNVTELSEMTSFHEDQSYVSAVTMPDRVTDWSSPVRPHGVSMDAGLCRTPGSQDLKNAKKELGASSHAFLNQVRGAAQRRKQNFTKSRDSLFAKEQKQREEIAASKLLLASKEVLKKAKFSVPAADTRSTSCRREPFKAKSVPVTNGVLGSGGLTGVPKVAKKQPTIPSSPLLGARRLNRPKVKALKEPNTKPRIFNRRKSMPEASINKENITFKARPAPPTTGHLGRSGQAGVPKVPKRPVTVPSSPCLGPRRKTAVVVPGNENMKENRRISTGMIKTRDEHKATKASPMVRPKDPCSNAVVKLFLYLC